MHLNPCSVISKVFNWNPEWGASFSFSDSQFFPPFLSCLTFSHGFDTEEALSCLWQRAFVTLVCIRLIVSKAKDCTQSIFPSMVPWAQHQIAMHIDVFFSSHRDITAAPSERRWRDKCMHSTALGSTPMLLGAFSICSFWAWEMKKTSKDLLEMGGGGLWNRWVRNQFSNLPAVWDLLLRNQSCGTKSRKRTLELALRLKDVDAFECTR